MVCARQIKRGTLGGNGLETATSSMRFRGKILVAYLKDRGWPNRRSGDLDGLRPPNQEGDARRKRLRNCHLVHALPGKNPGGIFERPWLAKSPEWRAEFCSRLKLCWDGLSFARSLDKMAYSGFHLGMSVFFKQEIWTENDIRRLDPGCGLETLLVTVNWSDFTDKEIIADFTKWLQSTDGRPSNYVGEFKNSTWWVCLERLARSEE